MVVKERDFPIIIMKLEALLRRLPLNHPKRPLIEEHLSKRKAGYRGEKRLDYFLSFLLDDKYFIFHDLRLINNNKPFQMDTLLLSRNFALIIEVKNMSGTLMFDSTFNQLIRTINDKEERFKDPFAQVKTQRIQLRSWMENKLKLTNFPIDYLIVNTNASTILKASNQRIAQSVVHVENVIEKIQKFDKRYENPSLSLQSLNHTRDLLIKEHTPLLIQILEKYDIGENEILQGVQCQRCFAYNVTRKKRKWHCQKCNTISIDAHKQAVLDYLLLIKETITNKECREFLQITSPKISYFILNSLQLPTNGMNKATKYYLPHHLISILEEQVMNS